MCESPQQSLPPSDSPRAYGIADGGAWKKAVDKPKGGDTMMQSYHPVSNSLLREDGQHLPLREVASEPTRRKANDQ